MTIGILLLAIIYLPVQAQQGTINDFMLTDAVSGQPVSLSDYQSKKGVLIIFTSNYCPYSKLYDARIASLASSYGEDIQFLLINPNSPGASSSDSFDKMKAKAKAAGYQHPYLADKNQEVANLLGATKTPEAFLLKPAASGFRVVYRGAIDDNPQVESGVQEPYLETAIKQLLQNGKVSQPGKRPTGCMIRKS